MLFKIVGIIMIVAPIGAFGAMAYTVGNFGLADTHPARQADAVVYTTMALFMFVVLNLIARVYGFSLWRFLKYIKEEILLVLGTSIVRGGAAADDGQAGAYGCARPIVGLVIPAGYSFNLDGTSIYLSMAAIFHGAGLGHRPHVRPGARGARRADADVEGRGGGDGLGVHRARRAR